MKKTTEITDLNFDEILKSNKVVLVDFWAEWCGPCRMIGPVIEELADEFKNKAIIGKMDVDNNPFTPGKFDIRSIPTLLIFQNQKLVDKAIGLVQKQVLVEKLNKYI
ncbi:MAG: thioredoxin [Chitinophagaceae bacterium]|nr:thioredoxin [Chitinophagaceae bacterium]